MLPGKKYTPEDFLEIAWKRKWLLLIPTLLVSAGTFVWAHFLPNRYQAETVILIVPQRVPQEYVRSTVTARVDDRLNLISQQILSRTRLERIIQEFNLYEKERRTRIMEDVIEQMRKDIRVDTATGRERDATDAFKVKFEASNARTAMLVTERLASLFVKENLEDRAVLADQTSEFLETQLEDARRRLIEHEKKLEEFRRQNAGQLPSQIQSNLQIMQSTQLQLQNLVEGMNRDRDQSRAIDREIADLLAAPVPVPSPVAVAAPGSEGPQPVTSTEQLAQAQAILDGVRLRWLDNHPAVRAQKRLVEELEPRAAAEQRDRPANATLPILPSNLVAQERVGQLRRQFEEVQLRIESRKREEVLLQEQLAVYRARLDATPARESELVELMRDYTTLQESYTTLLRKSEESKIAVNLERRQIGEQFKILDGARLPERPISPNRTRLNGMGALAGLGIGVALVALLEYRDTTLKTDADVLASLGLTVLAVIPMMMNQRERRRARLRKWALGLSASAAVALAATAVALWRLGLLRKWVG